MFIFYIIILLLLVSISCFLFLFVLDYKKGKSIDNICRDVNNNSDLFSEKLKTSIIEDNLLKNFSVEFVKFYSYNETDRDGYSVSIDLDCSYNKKLFHPGEQPISPWDKKDNSSYSNIMDSSSKECSRFISKSLFGYEKYRDGIITKIFNDKKATSINYLSIEKETGTDNLNKNLMYSYDKCIKHSNLLNNSNLSIIIDSDSFNKYIYDSIKIGEEIKREAISSNGYTGLSFCGMPIISVDFFPEGDMFYIISNPSNIIVSVSEDTSLGAIRHQDCVRVTSKFYYGFGLKNTSELFLFYK